MVAWTCERAWSVEPVSDETVRALLDPPEPPCLSLYLPTHRRVPDNRVDLPAFEHLVESLERALAETAPREDRERLLHPFRVLSADAAFWRHTHDGLAVLAAAGTARVYLLQHPVDPLAVVGRRFHTMPLLRAVASLERFNVLTLTSRSARVWEGRVWHDPNGTAGERLDSLAVVAVDGQSPVEELTRSDVISEDIFEPHRVKHGMGPGGRAGTAFVHGGFGSKQDGVDHDTEIFLRHVDTVVGEQVSRVSRLPLLLVASARLAASFRGIATNAHLLDDRVDLDPHLLTASDLAAAVAPVFSRARAARVARYLGVFERARDQSRATDDLAEAARAAAAGQVATLMVAADRFECGRLDREGGDVELHGVSRGDRSRSGDLPAVTGEDVYGALAETVVAKGGALVILAPDEMPTTSGIAAIYRYA